MPSHAPAAPDFPAGWLPREPSGLPPIEVDLAPAGRAVRGCLMLLLLLAVLAIIGLFVGISLLGGSLLRLFGAY